MISPTKAVSGPVAGRQVGDPPLRASPAPYSPARYRNMASRGGGGATQRHSLSTCHPKCTGCGERRHRVGGKTPLCAPDIQGPQSSRLPACWRGKRADARARHGCVPRLTQHPSHRKCTACCLLKPCANDPSEHSFVIPTDIVVLFMVHSVHSVLLLKDEKKP